MDQIVAAQLLAELDLLEEQDCKQSAEYIRKRLKDAGWCPGCGMRWHQCLCSHEED
jgi:hypothetical protein